MEQIESTEFVADFVTTAGAMGTEDEDNKTISQKDDKTHNAPSVHIISLYLALSCSISPSANLVSYLCNIKRLTFNV